MNAADEPAWRGEVESIQTGQKSAITDLQPALRLLSMLMAMEQQSE